MACRQRGGRARREKGRASGWGRFQGGLWCARSCWAVIEGNIASSSCRVVLGHLKKNAASSLPRTPGRCRCWACRCNPAAARWSCWAACMQPTAETRQQPDRTQQTELHAPRSEERPRRLSAPTLCAVTDPDRKATQQQGSCKAMHDVTAPSGNAGSTGRLHTPAA